MGLVKKEHCDDNNMNNTSNEKEIASRRDDVKPKADVEKTFEETMPKATSILRLVKRRPDLWCKPEMQELCALACEITGNSKSHQLAKVNEGWGFSTDLLTKGVGSLLFNKDVPIGLSTDETIMCTTHADNVPERNVVTELGATETNTCRWKIAAIGSDKKHINVRVDSTLSSAENLLIPGSITLISKSIPARWTYENRSDTRCAIIMKEFKVEAQHPVPSELLVGPTQNKCTIPVSAKKKVMHEKKKDHVETEANIAMSKRTGNLCSKNGVELQHALLHVFLLKTCLFRWLLGSACLQLKNYLT